ncbi:MAG: hypothetical protein BGO80_07670 [Devosia sp. 63-57]|nr:MAG: hypothetical protein ABS74_07100 [Pelagibacterium sp. SCN 63-126]OJX45657.1 MAG: hypothetical protein BGO80_07670 [Devosia sp. 63-57]
MARHIMAVTHGEGALELVFRHELSFPARQMARAGPIDMSAQVRAVTAGKDVGLVERRSAIPRRSKVNSMLSIPLDNAREERASASTDFEMPQANRCTVIHKCSRIQSATTTASRTRRGASVA